MEDKKISMVDIAKLSGVSIATVSRVLNKNGRYSKETEDRVLKVIQEHNYKVNVNAKGLRTKRTQTIGVIVPDITNEFFSQIVRAIERYIVPKGYTVFVCDSNEKEEAEDIHISSLAAKGVDGIIYISTRGDVKKIYESYKIPVVYIASRPQNDGTLVIADNEMGGFLATQELIEKGCRHILMLKDTKPFSTVVHRYKGYVGALEKYKIPFDPELVIETEVSYAAARKATKEALLAHPEMDGIFCNNDMMALGALHALREAKRKVPRDVKLVGFDGISLTEICDPPMTTVRQNTDELGKKSVEILLRRIHKKQDAKFHDEVVVIPVELVRRKTT